jgi:hypothetical protein
MPEVYSKEGDGTENGDKYSILLPTYNEHDNLSIIVWLIVKYMEKRWIRQLFSFMYRETLHIA